VLHTKPPAGYVATELQRPRCARCGARTLTLNPVAVLLGDGSYQ